MLIEPTELATEESRSAYQILDICSDAVYEEGHIPGAIHLSPASILQPNPPAAADIPPTEALIALFDSYGLDPSKPFVVYDDIGGKMAGRLFWTLSCFEGTTVHYLNGGLVAWLAERLPVTKAPMATSAQKGNWHYTGDALATREDCLAALNDGETLFWDARSPEEYTGLKRLTERGGHIPGAISFEFQRLLDPDNALRLRPFPALLTELSHAGITPEAPIVAYCQSHARSALAYMAARLMGFKQIRGYAGSWSDWGNREDTPIER